MTNHDDKDDKNATPSQSTIAIDLADEDKAKSAGDATCDIEPEATPTQPEGTLALEPETPATSPSQPGMGTMDFTADLAGEAIPVAPRSPDQGTVDFDHQPVDGATCEFSVDQAVGVATHGPGVKANLTTNVARPAAPEVGDATGEYQTEAVGGGAPSLASPGDATCDVNDSAASVAPGRATSLPPAARMTQSPTSKGPSLTAAPQGRAGRYVFKKFHAKGGMGEVWLAEDSDIGRPVALKRMLKGREKQKNGFMKEAQVTGQLEHPGIIPVHELSIDENGQPYYVMKFVHGKTLKEVIEEYHNAKPDADTPREVQWLKLLTTFEDLCQTIAYAHSRGVIHRDIKPDNVMVGAYGETLVLDWGLAKVVGEPEDTDDPYAAIHVDKSTETAATQAGSVKGTPFYFAPEVAAGKVDQVDQISDVYLLGGTLYQMITGKTPRTGKEMKQVLEMARNVPPPTARTLDPTVPKPLDAICSKALAHKREDRYPSAAALAEDMQRYLAGEPVSAYRETLMERTWRFVKKHRTAIGRTAGAAVLLAVISVAGLLIYRAQEDARSASLLAADLQKKDDARKDIASFRKSMEQARFYAASANPVSEIAPAFDADKAESNAKDALAIADKWGSGLADMPLEDQKLALKKDLYDLLLEVAQFKSRSPERKEEVQKDLAQALTYHEPTRSFYRVRSRVAPKEQAAGDAEKALAATTKASSLDHYLAGEQHRVDSIAKPEAIRTESLNKAIESYRQALRDDPDHYWSHFQLGACYMGLGAYAESAEAFGACIALNSKAPWGFSARGLALAQLSTRVSEAEADFDEALKLDPQFRPALMNRAAFHAKQKNFEKADAEFEALRGIKDERSRAWQYSRAQMYLDRAMAENSSKWFETARVNFEEATGDNKLKIPFAHIQLARIYLIQENNEKAIKHINLYLGLGQPLDERDYKTHEGIARELIALAKELKKAAGRQENINVQALIEFGKAIALRKNLAPPASYLALSRELMDLATTFSPEAKFTSRQTACMLALSQLEMAGKLAGAKAPAKDLEELGAKAIVLASRFHPDSKQQREATYQLAVALLERAAQRGDRQPSLYAELGKAEEKLLELNADNGEAAQRHLSRALAFYTKGLEIDPRYRPLLTQRGSLFVNFLKQYIKAKEDFALAVEVDSTHAESYAGLGYAEAMLRDLTQARRHAIAALTYGKGHYLLHHNVACIYAALSNDGLVRRQEYQDQALDQLQQAVELWKTGDKKGLDQITLLQVEPAFTKELRARPEFKKLIADNTEPKLQE